MRPVNVCVHVLPPSAEHPSHVTAVDPFACFSTKSPPSWPVQVPERFGGACLGFGAGGRLTVLRKLFQRTAVMSVAACTATAWFLWEGSAFPGSSLFRPGAPAVW